MREPKCRKIGERLPVHEVCTGQMQTHSPHREARSSRVRDPRLPCFKVSRIPIHKLESVFIVLSSSLVKEAFIAIG